jgi:acetyl-CoA carboxylase carboxyltransferase component
LESRLKQSVQVPNSAVGDRRPAAHLRDKCTVAWLPAHDGPDAYTAGTLFPRSSKKAACAINVASGNRPLVVLANLSGGGGRLRQRCR